MTEEIKNEEVFDAEAAFLDAATDVMDDDTELEDTVDVDETDENKESEDEEVQDDVSEESSEDIDDTDGSEIDEQSAATDYKALYDQVAAHNATLQTNLTDIESRFNSWKGRVEAEQRRAADEAVKAAKEPVKQEVDPELEDLMLEYPDLVPYVQKLIDNKVSNHVSGVEERVAQFIEQQVRPIATRIQESEVSAHTRAIEKAHPDMGKMIADGSLDQWIDSLPAYQQLGARQVCDHGTAQEVISLFDNFKASTGKSELKSPSKKQKATPTTTNVDKLKDALYVKSDPSEVKTDTKKSEDDPNKIFAMAAKEIMREEMA